VAILGIGGLLYLVLAYPDNARQVVPREMPLSWVNLGLLILLLLLILGLINYVRNLAQDD
jgi:hypothetical protein